MNDVVITAALRTAVGKFGGSIAKMSAADLGAHLIKALLARSGVAPDGARDEVAGRCAGGAQNGHFFDGAFASMTAALAPDPKAKTLGDLPFTGTGRVLTTDPVVFELVASKMPANMVFPLLPKIAQLKGIYIEYGAQENFTHIIAGARETAQRLSEAGISNTLEVFQGDHVNHFDQRIKERVLPWVSTMIAK